MRIKFVTKQFGSPICILKCGRHENQGEGRKKESKRKKKD
jgi:hypothetical protein